MSKEEQEKYKERSDTGAEALIQARAAEVLASTVPEGDFFANAIWGRDFTAAYQHDPTAFFVIDVRRREDFCRGHIEGAMHVDFTSWARKENLARLPEGRKIIVVCDNGCKSAQVSAGLRLLGYDAAIIRTGMSGWVRTANTEITISILESAGAPVQRAEAQDCARAPEGVSFGELSVEAFELIATRLEDQFTRTPLDGGAAYNIIAPEELHRNLNNGDGEYFLLDLREDFEFEGIGHIEGARWLDFNAAVLPENLALLPRDRKIVTICYTGNMAAQLSTVLRLLGYEAIVLNLGMAGWIKNPTTQTYIKDILAADGPVSVLDEAEFRRKAAD
jgi:rhodanese-related sulfurtransferase